jgi:diguanylate cyclase (GGDEF)-like protein
MTPPISAVRGAFGPMDLGNDSAGARGRAAECLPDYDLIGRPNRGHRETIRLLLVGHSPAEEQALRELSSRLDAPRFEWAQVESLELALARMAVRVPDVMLIRLRVHGDEMDAVHELVNRHPSVSVIAIVPPEAEAPGLAAIHMGAQDYVVSGRADAERLRHMIRTTVERNRLWSALRETALIDELTGLYNRRGFLALARQQLRLAQRAGLDATLLFVDIDNMKRINDTLGHRYGDMALIETADYLRGSFRDADLVGRIGGDEFVVLALESVDSPVETLVSRLEQRLKDRTPGGGPYELRLSIGRAEFTPDAPSPIEALLAVADSAMYKQKQAARTSAACPENVELLSRIA